MTTEGYGRDSYGRDRYGSLPELGLLQAYSLGPTSVGLRFATPLDPTHGSTLNPASYSIPGLTVLGVQFLYPDVLRLITTPQSWLLYVVTVDPPVRNISYLPIEIDQRVGTFTGYALTPALTGNAISSTRIQILVTDDLLLNAALSDPSSYQVISETGLVLTVIAVFPRTFEGITKRIDLDVATPLIPLKPYRVVLGSGIQTTDGRAFVPPETTVVWRPKPLVVAAAIADFSGEVQGGLFGTPAGQVFFSPSLEAPAPTSAIQVDDLSVCSRAYEVYAPPVPVDPMPLRTFGTFNPGETNNPAFVLWAPFPRLQETKFDLVQRENDPYAGAVDGRCVAVLEEPLDPAFISLLNVPYWQTFGTGVLNPFKTANNLAPIPPGSTTTVIIVPLSLNQAVSLP